MLMMWRRNCFAIPFISATDSLLQEATSAADCGAEASVFALFLPLRCDESN
jgi:hypothetical protein